MANESLHSRDSPDARREQPPAPPDVGSSPSGPVAGPGYYPALTAASTTLWALLLGPVLTTIPGQVDHLAPESRVAALAVVTSVGGMVGILAGPLIGRLSDATDTRWGRRRPWLTAGAALILAASYAAGRAGSVC